MGDKFYRTVFCCHWSLLNKTGHYFFCHFCAIDILAKTYSFFSIFLNCFLARCFVIHIELLSMILNCLLVTLLDYHSLFSTINS